MEQWPTSDLPKLCWKDKEAKSPRYTAFPLIAVLYQGKHYLIDGRRRVNKALHEGAPGPHAMIVVVPEPNTDAAGHR